MSRFATTLGASLMSAAILISIPVGALAAKGVAAGPPPKHANTAGKVQGILGDKQLLAFGTLTAKDDTASTLTINEPGKGLVTVKFTAKTHFRSADKAARTATIQVNDQIGVEGKASTGEARTVQFDTVVFPVTHPLHLDGTAALAANGLTLTLKDGTTVNVTVSTKARVHVNGQKAGSLSTLTANQRVDVIGQLYSDGTFIAMAVVVHKPK